MFGLFISLIMSPAKAEQEFRFSRWPALQTIDHMLMGAFVEYGHDSYSVGGVSSVFPVLSIIMSGKDHVTEEGWFPFSRVNVGLYRDERAVEGVGGRTSVLEIDMTRSIGLYVG